MNRQVGYMDGPREWDLRVGPTVAATLVASAALTGAFHYDVDPGKGFTLSAVELEADHTWAMEVFPEQVKTSETIANRAVGLGSPKLERTTKQVSVPGVRVEEHRVKSVNADYAPTYTEVKFDNSAVSGIKTVVEQYQYEGWTDIRLQIRGEASAEDDMTRADAGLTTPSPENQNLAALRGQAFADLLTEQGVVGPGVEVEVLPATEGSLDAGQMVALAGMAEKFGYDDVSHMVGNWNAGKDVPPSVATTLEAWLPSVATTLESWLHRGASVTIIGERPGEERTVEREEEQMVCVVPVRAVTTNIIQEKPRHAPIPKFGLVPVPVILPRRRGTSRGVKGSTAGVRPVSGADGVGMTGAGVSAEAPLLATGGGASSGTERPTTTDKAHTTVNAEAQATRIPRRPVGTDKQTFMEYARGERDRHGCLKPILVGAALVATTVGLGFLISRIGGSAEQPNRAPAMEVAPPTTCDPALERRESVVQTQTIDVITDTDGTTREAPKPVRHTTTTRAR